MSRAGPAAFGYDGRLFRPVHANGAPTMADAPVARYHQSGNLVWAEFAGGQVQRGAIAGTCAPGGVLSFGYCMVLTDGEVVLGRCHSSPELLADGRIRLTERWERCSPHAATGISYLEEVPTGRAGADGGAG